MSSWDIEERVTTVIARLAGLSASHIGPDLALEHLGCDRSRILDLIEIIENEIGVSSGICRTTGVGIPRCVDTLWDLVTLFHWAQYAFGPHHRAVEAAQWHQTTIKAGDLVIKLW
jgi:hypothetical protein